MSLPPPRPPASMSMAQPKAYANATPPSAPASDTTSTSQASTSKTGTDFTYPSSSSSTYSPTLEGYSNHLISPYNKSLRALDGHDATDHMDESFPTPPFLASILASHSTTTTSTPVTRTNSSSYRGGNPSFESISAIQPSPNPSAALYTLPPAPSPPEDPLIPPENFSLVASGVYRSGFPKKKNFRFMETLKLKTVLTLVLEEYPAANLKWCEEQDIQFMQFGIPGNKEPFDNIPEDVICSALVAILDRRNHPVLIHCNKGKHRTGCLIGCIRRLQAWSLTSIFDEYRRFSIPKSRAVDQQFIDLFDLSLVWDEAMSETRGGGGIENLPEWGMLSIPRSAGRGPSSSAIAGRAIRRDRGSMAGL